MVIICIFVSQCQMSISSNKYARRIRGVEHCNDNELLEKYIVILYYSLGVAISKEHFYKKSMLKVRLSDNRNTPHRRDFVSILNVHTHEIE